MRLPKPILYVLFIIFAAVLVYQIPAIKTRLEWRLDIAGAAVRSLVDPAGEAPTPLVQITRAPTPTRTPAPTPTPGPTATPMPSPTALPGSISLPAPRWEKQDWNNCGPATLSMYLNYYGWEGDQFSVSDRVKPERADRNVNVEELLYFTQNNAGWLQSRFWVGGTLEQLKEFLANGIPVMIEEGSYLEETYLFNDDHWAGHYLLLTGYDDASGSFTGQDSFYGADRVVPYQKLDQNWKIFNRVFLLVYLPHQEEAVKAILGDHWDTEFNRQAALETAQAEVDADPSDVYAWFNLGTNLVYFERYDEAVAAYDQSRELGWPMRMMRYQFGPYIAYLNTGLFEDLIALADYNLKITDNSEEAFIWRGWALYQLGDITGAIESFRLAYEANPTSIDAQSALAALGVNP